MGIKKTVETLVAAVTSTDVAAIEGELTKLEQRRAQLAESLDAATHNAVDASAVRREMIIANRDQQTLEKANARVREAEERRVALDDALRALDQKIAETTTHFEEAKDKAERDRIAQVLEQEADAVEKATLAIDKAAKQFASAYRQLRSAMSAASSLRTPESRLGDDRVAGLLAAEALAGAAPDLFVSDVDELGTASILARGFALGEDMTTRLAFTSSLFLAAIFNGVVGRVNRRLLERCQGAVPRGGSWRRRDQGLPQDARQGPVRRLQGGVAQGGKRQGLCG